MVAREEATPEVQLVAAISLGDDGTSIPVPSAPTQKEDETMASMIGVQGTDVWGRTSLLTDNWWWLIENDGGRASHSEPLCWNCREPGHKYAACHAPKRQFCRGCERMRK